MTLVPGPGALSIAIEPPYCFTMLKHVASPSPTPFPGAFVVKNGGRYFLFNEKGDLIIAKLTPEKYEELGRAHLLEPTNTDPGRPVVWSHPAFANRCVYARNDREIICVSVAAAGRRMLNGG